MAKRNRSIDQIDGQMCFDLSTDRLQYVVQANRLIEGKQNLKLNSAKILRLLIMQIKPDDDDFKTYRIKIADLARLLRVTSQTLYRDIDILTNDILTNYVTIRDSSKTGFVKIPWVTACAYHSSKGLSVMLNPLLKPYLLGLKDNYTQYQLDCILRMRSTYALRIFELLEKENMLKFLPKEGITVDLTIQEIREACDCEEKYQKISQFRLRVLDVAVKEIQRTTTYEVSYSPIKNGRNIDAVRFQILPKFRPKD